ncbi:RNA-binding domain-containing protein [Okeanomitos corallinicola TIOX110]|uniref:RNA-binding domain-containing protein n=1 Tax=Okeanomitos corallinicola TIOX110 TaxID=3133117 RepID=A0ABZ2UP97_9CYAN
MELENLIQRLNLGEDYDYEFKASQDKLSKDVWETVSAFANTSGGYIILGVTENKQKFKINGINNPTQQKKDFWNNHNNPQKLSVPICQESDVTITKIEDKDIIIIKVPPANRLQRPVYINKNPITGTYKRYFDGDHQCSEEEVKQMLRDQGNEAQDSQVLDHFDMNDLDSGTIKIYRQRFSNREPDHPWLILNDQELMLQLGGYNKDRNTGKEGLTIAGLLMFGKERSILDAFSHYHLDYQENLSNDPEQRWTYRITLDGKWEANLFNFYHRVYNRLVHDLAVPFKLDQNSIREDETHVHEALREVLVNSLIHADYLSTKPMVIFKLHDIFWFSNPGRLRITISQLYEGGISEPRNPNLQKMFKMIGLGEKAGSGFAKILRAWKEQQWFIPLVREKLDLDITTVALPMISLIPEQVEKELTAIVGTNYFNLPELEKIILVLAHKFGKISNTNIQYHSQKHPRDIGDSLKYLVDNGCLEKFGHGRWTEYSLPNNSLVNLLEQANSDHLNDSSDHLNDSSDHLDDSSDHLDDSSDHLQKLVTIATPVRDKRKVSKQLMEEIILKICQNQYLTQQQLANILNRSPHTLRTSYLTPMVKNNLLILKYPDTPTHPHQSYLTNPNSNL